MRTVRGIVVMLVLLCVPGTAGAERWMAIGPPGGSVRALAADPHDPQRLYLGTADGVLYRSSDGGRHWQRPTPGFPRRGCSLDAIAVGDRGTVFVGFWEVGGPGGGLARSDDGGRSFALLKGVDHESVRALALAPSDPQTLAVGTLSGVFLSTNGGRAWTRVTPQGDADLRNIESVAFDPRDARVVYVGTWHLAWKTSDGGATWSPIHRGMVDDSDVMTLTVDPRDSQTVYATACTGVYVSSRGGFSWTLTRGIPKPSRRTRAFAIDPRDSKRLLAGTTEGLWSSENGGRAWRRVTDPDLVVNAVLARPDGTILLGAEEAGVLRSEDGGRTWSASNDGFSEQFVQQIAWDPVGRRLLIVVRGGSRYDGVFASSDLRGPWVHLDDGLEGRHVLALATLQGTLVAGTDDGPTRVGSVELHPAVKHLLARGRGLLLAATSTGLFRSVDGGGTWSPSLLPSSEISALAQSAGESDVIVAATPRGVFRSQDRGESWTVVSSSLRGVTCHALAFLPGSERVLFAATSGGLFRSDDQGTSWTRIGGMAHADLSALAIHPDGRTLYAADFGLGGVFRSADEGATWTRVPTDGLTSERVWALAFDPAERLLASASAGGLHLLVPPTLGLDSGGDPDHAAALGR
ncbi:MAG: hypothetical protein E6K80_07005 [Candidatus Eisenbacteria bacterium]|uniref:Photosynthesis system II assembly factor Ycf48/Hcf136-like domain-containing protein n=1 Tax=Eiseniibacteriota bacterium TaxID=2212470 RepID=A0A538U4Y3_UNCEI|nr:MAG: hypothetical protein E6K80_07005 [Candidatus Eisenbacteria bacterium]